MSKNIKEMIADIEGEVLLTRGFIGKDQLSAKVMAAMATVPRDKFVPPELQALAFSNGPLMIGHGQTISQPYIVALMTDLLELTKESTVLEIGTGSGYQTAVLSLLAKKVYSVELISALAEAAKERLQNLNFTNIETHIGNGYEGWLEHAPYDAIIVTAAAAYIPPALTEQLKSGGKMVIPVGLPNMYQELLLITKDQQNTITTRSILGVAFVPLVQQAPMDA
ncbi:MAG: protein-L-isoaspartate(D-aspartate) O-methyltransferase [Gammaproteobacteria bacterium]|nr:protein-L-isoaspartate(D-aspartate) O-methyltransferase [Gammaproteobacteria bacterium]